MYSMTSLASGDSHASNFDLCNAAIPEFVNLDQRKYHCVKCKRLLRNPQQIKCGHRICQECCTASFAEVPEAVNRSEKKKISCPSSDDEACDDINEDEVFPDFSAVREMKLLMVFCRYKKHGCLETMQWSKLDTHLQNCPHRLKTCKYCHVQVPVEQYESHVDKECPQCPCKCPYGCKDSTLTRLKLESHSKHCTMKPVTCKYESMGCTYKGTANEISVHEEDHRLHLEILFHNSRKLQDENSFLKESLERVQSEISSLNQTIERLTAERRALEMKMIEIPAEITRANERQLCIIAKQDTKFASLAAQLKGHERITQEMALIKIRQNQQDTMISELDKKSPERTLSLPEDVRQKFIMHDRTIGMHDKRLSELGIRCQCLETSSLDGTLVWKITDYSKRKEEAKNGQHLSLYSQHFYSGRYGYKMCSRVYINGDGAGRGTHLSLFFVIMGGEYDDILSWPFRQKVTLMVLDQSNNRTNHLTDVFRPDPTSNSFQKPVGIMNVASGCPLFAAHSVIENPNGVFLKNDTLFLKIVVETNDLVRP